jgi:hypothetical protein
MGIVACFYRTSAANPGSTHETIHCSQNFSRFLILQARENYVYARERSELLHQFRKMKENERERSHVPPRLRSYVRNLRNCISPARTRSPTPPTIIKTRLRKWYIPTPSTKHTPSDHELNHNTFRYWLGINICRLKSYGGLRSPKEPMSLPIKGTWLSFSGIMYKIRVRYYSTDSEF